MEIFLYKSSIHTDRILRIGQMDDLSFKLLDATFLTDDENKFATIEQIEEYLEDQLTMVIQQH